MLLLRKIWPYLLIIGLALPLLWPLLRPGFFVSDDGEWMIIRLAAFSQTLKGGQFPVRFLETLNHGYGYPVTNFLYPLPFYLGSLVHFLGLSFIGSVKLLFAIDIVGGSIFVFLFLKERFKTIAAVIGAIGFLSHPYIIFDLYKRGSLGELTAIMFATATILFLTKYLKGSRRFYFSLAVLFWAATITSHNTVGLISAVVILVLPVFLKEQFKTTDFLRTGAAFGMALLVSAFFWIPAIGEYGLTIAPSIDVANYRDYFLNFVELGKFLSIPILVIIAIFAHQIISRDTGRLTRVCLLLLAISAFFASSLSTPFWDQLPLGRIVQFPWRFISLFIIVAPVVIAGVVKSKRSVVIACMLLGTGYLFQISQLKVQHINRDDAYYETNDDTTTVKGEYLTKFVKTAPTKAPVEPIEILDGVGSVEGNSVRLSSTARVRVNKMYYPGHVLMINGETGRFDYKTSGFIETYLPQGDYTIETGFTESPLRFFSDLLSVVGVLTIFALVLVTRKPGSTSNAS